MTMSDRSILLAACWSMGLTMLLVEGVRPLLPVLAHDLGASPALIGVMVGAFAAVPLFLAIPMGYWIVRTGTGRLSPLAAVGLGGAVLLVALWPTYLGLLLSQLLLGISHLAFAVDTQTTATSVGDPRERVRSLSLYTTFISGGQLVGPLLVGILTDAFGYRVTTALMSILAVPLLFTARHMRPGAGDLTAAAAAPSAADAGGAAPGGRVLVILREPVVWLSILGGFAVIFEMTVRQSFLPLYVEGLGYSSTTWGSLLSVRAAAAMLGRVLIDRLMARAGGQLRLMVAALVVTAVGLGAVPFVSSVAGLFVLSIIVGAAAGLVLPLSMALLAEGVEKDVRGLAVAVRLTGNRVAQLLSPVAVGFIAEVLGIGAAFYAAGAILLLVAAVIGPLGRSDPGSEPAGDRSGQQKQRRV